ncbi:hypothetical protein QQ020_21280 [Fulvivirgaceae bacterium BMA12]|uniref:C2H2-type domain-containing protein n=1 Tax=Agaribacillus aureus TaxID=3051825 RepID=A0ABT8LE72_9BACT|nr:hypothetical protein [Fulvivirgaceae bacterium BMA12]
MQRNTEQKIVEETSSKGYKLRYSPGDGYYSSDELRIITADPPFEPSKSKQRQAIEFLISELGEYHIKSILATHPQFVDPGENFESVACNLCGEPLKMDDWQEFMSTAHESKFHELSILPKCCDKETSLNKLTYSWQAGFSKYRLSIIGFNPNENKLAKLMDQLEKILETNLKVIRAKY